MGRGQPSPAMKHEWTSRAQLLLKFATPRSHPPQTPKTILRCQCRGVRHICASQVFGGRAGRLGTPVSSKPMSGWALGTETCQICFNTGFLAWRGAISARRSCRRGQRMASLGHTQARSLASSKGVPILLAEIRGCRDTGGGAKAACIRNNLRARTRGMPGRHALRSQTRGTTWWTPTRHSSNTNTHTIALRRRSNPTRLEFE